MDSQKITHSDRQKITIAIGLAALNVTIASIVSAFKIPIYLDSIGLVVGTILLGWRFGSLIAISTTLVGFILINPYLPAYTATAIGIVVSTEALYRVGMFRTISRSAISGVAIASVSAILSAPITAFLFSGNTLSGVDALTAFLLASGQNIIDAVLITSFTSEPIDKVIVCLLAYSAIKSIPLSSIKSASIRGLQQK